MRVWVAQADFGAAKQALIRAVKMELDQAGIGIPFPQMDVHLVPDGEGVNLDPLSGKRSRHACRPPAISVSLNDDQIVSPRVVGSLLVDVFNLAEVPAFTTKDGSEIRELLAHRNSCIANQSLAEARLPVGRSHRAALIIRCAKRFTISSKVAAGCKWRTKFAR